ncbi:hypothetical protein SAMN02910289_01152 [Lachnospiraceae bacterium RM5]|nr:hypothetical protein SAMN02910289_01152 [Lachnospiraceae bacterium RM5]
MKYIFFESEKEKYWIEINDDNFATRQIILSDGLYHVSALEDCLAEGQIINGEFEADFIDISKKNFEIAWNDALRDYRKIWESIKNNYKLNSNITATLMYFYPQGAIFKVNNIIINYIGENEVQLHEKLNMKIVGYDETNMWIITR